MTELEYNNALKLLFHPDTHEIALMQLKNKISIKSILKKYELDKLGINTPAKLRKFVCDEYDYWTISVPVKFSISIIHRVLGNLKFVICWRPTIAVRRTKTNILAYKQRISYYKRRIAQHQKTLDRLLANPPKKITQKHAWTSFFQTKDLI